MALPPSLRAEKAAARTCSSDASDQVSPAYGVTSGTIYQVIYTNSPCTESRNRLPCGQMASIWVPPGRGAPAGRLSRPCSAPAGGLCN